MEFSHAPVLLQETVENLKVRPGGIYVDGTLGGGGHAVAVLTALGGQGTFIGIDRDTDALTAAKQRLAGTTLSRESGTGEGRKTQLHFIHDNFHNIKEILKSLQIEGIDGALLDLGVSSFQLDNAERGFSYMQDAPLDMRMNREDRFTAADVVNTYGEKELADVIRKYGEERWAARIAAKVVQARQNKPITRSAELVNLIKSAIPAKARREGPHPAKRTFQAIRIEVNDELGPLGQAVEDFLDVLNPGGRLCVISFHSLEDRIVKNVYQKRANPCTCPPDFPVCVCGKVADIKRVKGKPIEASPGELESNPRARSAKLRVAQKLG